MHASEYNKAAHHSGSRGPHLLRADNNVCHSEAQCSASERRGDPKMQSFSAPKNRHDLVEKLARDTTSDLTRYFERRVVLAHEAQDLVGQTVLALCSNPERIPTDPTKARMWCFGIARNVLRTFYTRSARRRNLHDLLLHRARLSRSVAEDAESSVLARGESATIATALARLSPEVRELTLMVEVDGLSNRAAALLLDLDEKTARAKRELGLEKLRQPCASGRRRRNANGRPNRMTAVATSVSAHRRRAQHGRTLCTPSEQASPGSVHTRIEQRLRTRASGSVVPGIV